MADYAPPTLNDLYALIGRDLTDPFHQVFNTSQLTDFINGGISEVNRVKPLETSALVSYDASSGSLDLTNFPFMTLFQVELVGPASGSVRSQMYVPHVSGAAPVQDGWDFFARTLTLGPLWEDKVTHLLRDLGWNLRIWGYRPRDPLINESDIAEFIDLNDEMAVRLFCRMESFRALNSDRSLFQQWQQQANNSDVSPTQLNGMLGTSEAAFDRQQKRIFVLRRQPRN